MARLQHWADAFDHRLSDSDPSFFFGESNHMSNVETLIDSTMWLCDIETLRSLGTETNEDVYICHVCSMSFLLMFWPPMFRWFHTERSCYFPPRTIWRDFPPQNNKTILRKFGRERHGTATSRGWSLWYTKLLPIYPTTSTVSTWVPNQWLMVTNIMGTMNPRKEVCCLLSMHILNNS